MVSHCGDDDWWSSSQCSTGKDWFFKNAFAQGSRHLLFIAPFGNLHPRRWVASQADSRQNWLSCPLQRSAHKVNSQHKPVTKTVRKRVRLLRGHHVQSNYHPKACVKPHRQRWWIQEHRLFIKMFVFATCEKNDCKPTIQDHEGQPSDLLPHLHTPKYDQQCTADIVFMSESKVADKKKKKIQNKIQNVLSGPPQLSMPHFLPVRWSKTPTAFRVWWSRMYSLPHFSHDSENNAYTDLFITCITSPVPVRLVILALTFKSNATHFDNLTVRDMLRWAMSFPPARRITVEVA